MTKIYNSKNGHLEFYQQEATSDFWDTHWHQHWKGDNESFAQTVVCKKDSLVSSILDKYVPGQEAKIIEAGCGNGHFVYFMDYLGYKNAYGIDFAGKTVALINQLFPDLKIYPQDIRQTNFPDHYFDLYLSFGVIEHFYEGYGPIIKEAQRIVKPGGYLAISFPQMSWLRKTKSYLGFYRRKLPDNQNHFYQFAFDPQKVAADLKNRYQLALKEVIFYDAIKGLKDEVALFRPLLRKLYNYHGSSRWIKKLKSRLDRLAKPWTSHMAMLILQHE